MSERVKSFEAWGIVELMGHQRVAGRISERAIGGGNLLQVDIPQPDESFRTVFYGNSAIYALHVTDEAAARACAKVSGTRPTYAWELENATRRLEAPAPPRPYRSDRDDDLDEPEGTDESTDSVSIEPECADCIAHPQGRCDEHMPF